MFDLSIVVPGIRPQNWMRLYTTLTQFHERNFEVIFVGPEKPDWINKKYTNVKFIEDWGSQIRCLQLGLLAAEGEYLNACADDGWCIGSMDGALDYLRSGNEMCAVSFKYLEGDNSGSMENAQYYYMKTHPCTNCRNICPHFLLLNTALVKTEYVRQLGGFDCRFFGCMAHADFAARWQNCGYGVLLWDEPIYQCEHMPGETGDHGPIHRSQIFHDEPLFRQIYDSDGGASRTVIYLENWKYSPARWKERFGA
jgi:hypothetical protein